jgi:3-dehydroquinate synthase
MKTIEISGTKKSSVFIGESFNNAGKYLPGKQVVIVTDEVVDGLYGDQFPDFPKIVLGTGEEIKTLATVEHIIRQLIGMGIDRHGFLLGIGGGIVCDITGFAASVFMRGIDFGFVSTTLLSQVDASVGGKNGVNFDSYKNIVGNFNQPGFVICDLSMLKTLPEKEVRCGMGEVVKHALIKDAGMLEYIEKNHRKALALDEEVTGELVYRSIKIKSEVVNADEREQGERKKLNFGHTLAHAIEKHADISHGEAVSIGIMFASQVSYLLGMFGSEEVVRIKSLLESLDLPVRTTVDKALLAEAIEKDKKKNDRMIDFVLLDKLGNAVVKPVQIEEVKEWIFELI